MDAITRIISTCIGIMMCLYAGAQQMHWNRLADDTLYYANEYLPDRMMVTSSGPGQIWDFRTLRAPFSLGRRIVVTGEREGNTYAHLTHGKESEAILRLVGKNSEIIQEMENNPLCPGRRLSFILTPAKKPFFHNILGGSYSYKGTMQATFAWPRDVACHFKPTELPDSCRITYSMVEEIVVDAEGTLFLPTEVNSVYRHHVTEKKTVKVETWKGNRWRDVTASIPGLQLITYREMQRFVLSTTGLPLVELELKDDMRPTRIEFKTHPLVTRVFTEQPTKPDIFAYPNPSFDVVRFQTSDLPYGRYKLSIFNILGVAIRDFDFEVDDPHETISMDLGDLQRGTYLFRLQDSFGRTIKTKRVVLIQP